MRDDNQTELTRDITPTYKYNPYPYQLFPFRVYEQGIRRIILVWPRRAGKDLTALNFMLQRALERVGTYFYFLPTHKQAKKIIWDGMDDEGNKFLDYIPAELIAEKNESELQIKLINESIIQLIGSDSIDTSALGTNCIGAVFSEYAVQHPDGWDFVRPILRKNGGWAMFLYTPRGRNHGYMLYNLNQSNPEWACNKLIANQVRDDQGHALIPESFLDAERRSGMSEDKIQQEYNTSFSGIQQGSFFGDQCTLAEREGRYGHYPYDSDYRVYTVSDLGKGLNFCTWYFQVIKGTVRFIDFHALESGAIPEFVKDVKSRPYIYAGHYAPHDVKTTELGTGQTRLEAARRLGLNFVRIPVLPVPDRIDAGRRLFPISYFHKDKITAEVPSKSGWDALLNYRREYDEMKLEYSNDEYHDWASHGGSAYTYAAVAVRRILGMQGIPEQASTSFDEHEDIGVSYETDFDEMYDDNKDDW